MLILFTMVMVSAGVFFRPEPKLEDLMMSVLPLFSIVLPACACWPGEVTPVAEQRIFLSLAFLFRCWAIHSPILSGSGLAG